MPDDEFSETNSGSQGPNAGLVATTDAVRRAVYSVLYGDNPPQNPTVAAYLFMRIAMEQIASIESDRRAAELAYHLADAFGVR